MSNHDYIIANAVGATFRSDLNDALAALVSNNSSASEPSTMYAYMWWADTTTGLLKQRNSANSAWVTQGTLAGLGTNVAALLASFTSANLAAALTDEISPASGLVLFGTAVSTTCELADAATAGNVSVTAGVLNYQISGGWCHGNLQVININTSGLTPGYGVFIRGLPTARTITTARFPISQTVGGTVAMPAIGYGGYASSGSTYLTLHNIVSDITTGTGDIWITFSYPV